MAEERRTIVASVVPDVAEVTERTIRARIVTSVVITVRIRSGITAIVTA
jgi:hypothetical protein